MRSTSTLLLIALVCAACGSNGASDTGLIVENPFRGSLQDGPPPFQLTLEQSFGVENNPESGILANIVDVAVDEEGCVYILERTRLLAFDADGDLLWVTGSEGEGPGEFNFPRSLVYDGQRTLYVSNQSGTRTDAYSADGAFLDAVSMDFLERRMARLIGTVNDTTALGLAPEFGALATHVMVLDPSNDWRQTGYYLLDQTEDVDVSSQIWAGQYPVLVGDEIMTNHSLRYEIAVYSPRGDTLRIIRREAPAYLPPTFLTTSEYSTVSIPTRKEGPFAVGSDLVVNYVRWPTDMDDPKEYLRRRMNGEDVEVDYHGTLDFFTSDGELIYALGGDEFDELDLGIPIMGSEDGHLYVERSTPWPRIDRYRVERVDP